MNGMWSGCWWWWPGCFCRNSTLTKLSTLVEGLQDRQARQERDNTDSHRRLWKHNDGQDAALNDHETRITILERKEETR